MSYAIVGLLFVMLVVFVVLAAKTWHWVNLVFVVLIFMVGVGAAISTAQVLKFRQRDMADAFRQQERVERLEKEMKLVIFGPADSASYGEDSLRRRADEMLMEQEGRGRVWKGGQIEANGNNRVFKFSVVREELANGGGTMQDMILYVFSDGPIQLEDGSMVEKAHPIGFVGTVRVVNEGADSVEMEPIFIANNNEYAEPSGPWTVFEKMPLDRNDAFDRVGRIKPDGFDITAFRETLVNKHMPAGLFGLDPNGEVYEKLIDSYAFDGVSIGEIESWLETNKATRINTRFEPKLEEIFIQYEFTKKSRDYEVDSAGNLANDGLFSQGRAVATSLHAGGTIKFAKGDKIYVDQLNATGYQTPDQNQVAAFNTREEVNEIKRVYVRELRDYPYILRELTRETTRFISEIKRVKANNETTQIALNDTQSQIQVRDGVIADLQADQVNLKTDAASIKKLEAARRQEFGASQESLKSLESDVEANYEKVQKANRVIESKTK